MESDAISLTVFILVGSFTYIRTYFSDKLLGADLTELFSFSENINNEWK